MDEGEGQVTSETCRKASGHQMSRRGVLHPDHAAEQAFIERVHSAEERSRERAARAPEMAPDKYSARIARERLLQRLSEDIDTDALCFGRIDQVDGRTLYLGRGAIRDDGNELLVINWRMPVAAPFYTANAKESHGIAARRRFQLDRLRLLGIVEDSFGDGRALQTTPAAVDAEAETHLEEVLADPLEEEEQGPLEPHLVDAILADMERARGTEMRDIVATIEARQYELISDVIDGLLVIQGGPGSGKTAIALHRAAWLLFNHREELERSGVLVVGPNRAFMEYVSHVLPSLGETAVVQTAVDRLPDLADVRVRAAEPIDVSRVKGDLRMASVIQRAVMSRVRKPSEDVGVTVGRRLIVLPAARLRELIDASWRTGRHYLRARDVFRRELVRFVRDSVAEEVSFRAGPSAEEVETAVTADGGPLDRIWPTVTAPEVLRDLLNSRQRLKSAGASELTPEELELLQRDRSRSIREEPWSSADMPLLDEADYAIRGLGNSYGYVIADEAQDLSPMQLRMIFRRSPSGRGTLVGDIAQATGSTRFLDWTELYEAAGLEAPLRIAELAIGYRVPRQIMELAAELLPRVAPQVVKPRAVRQGSEAPRVLQIDQRDLASALVREVASRLEGERSVGVIAPTVHLDPLRGALREAGIAAGDLLTDGLGRQVTVLSAEQAKGLEFDHVVVAEPVAVAGPAHDWAYVYIALTRATRTLSVLHTTAQPFEAPSAEPVAGPDIGLDDVPVVSESGGVTLGARYTEALMQAKFLHAGQNRRGTLVPYLAHLQAVAALVLEDGGSEDEAIAALLHDAVEDVGPHVLDTIEEQFGTHVALIVAGCTDPEGGADAGWRDQKILHIRELEHAGPEVRRVALAEKLDNARALLRDYRRLDDALWTRMEVDPDDLLWYMTALADLFTTERPGDMAAELNETVERLLDLATLSTTSISSENENSEEAALMGSGTPH